MNMITEAVEYLRLLSGARVDCNFKQGREAVFEQFFQQIGIEDDSSVDEFIAHSQDCIVKLAEMVAPYQLPNDYIFFLEFYGGLAIYTETYSFEILGIGPMVPEWYENVKEYNFTESEEIKELHIGSLLFESINAEHSNILQPNNRIELSPRRDKAANPFDDVEYIPHQGVKFFIDLAGTIQKNCIIGLGPERGERRTWKKVTNSFTEWLEQAAITDGKFGYS